MARTTVAHISRIEIRGFKSFGFENTVIRLRPGLVGITGPNGSGKSNILGAILFALGEDRLAALHACSLEDLVHCGSPGGDTVRVSVRFDNTDRRIPVGSDTVSITRVMNRSCESRYDLNGSAAGRDDIAGVMDAANPGPHRLVSGATAYRLAGLSPQDMRAMLEDTIGLSVPGGTASGTTGHAPEGSVRGTRGSTRTAGTAGPDGRRFTDAFAVLDGEIRRMSQKIGIDAWLELDEPGISYMIRLPGGQARKLASCRTREKDLAGIVLILALQKLRQPQFCLLDGVDALLGGTAAERFSRLLGEHAEAVQSIIVPHGSAAGQILAVRKNRGASHVLAC